MKIYKEILMKQVKEGKYPEEDALWYTNKRKYWKNYGHKYQEEILKGYFKNNGYRNVRGLQTVSI